MMLILKRTANITNLTWGRGAWWPSKMFLTTVLKRLGEGCWKLVTFNINLWSIKNSYFWFPMLSGVTITTSLSESTQDFLKLSFHMFPYNEIFKIFKSNIWLDIWNKHPKIPRNTKFQPNQWRGLGVTSIWNLGFCHQLKYRFWRHPNCGVQQCVIMCFEQCWRGMSN